MTVASMGAARKCRGAAPGTDLIGARGATPADQRTIDRTVVGICAGAVWTEGECARHGKGAECRRNIRL
ncbi:hypothetical protein [Sinorhizobium medicae]|nr:hypothetical protein [Sinorhizobium medicae]